MRISRCRPVPGRAEIRDNTDRAGARRASARQFYYQRATGLLSVTVANFADGPAEDQKRVDDAAANLHRRGEVRFDASVEYDPGIGCRPIQVALPKGRLLLASVYMARHRLYITEATSEPNDS